MRSIFSKKQKAMSNEQRTVNRNLFFVDCLLLTEATGGSDYENC